MRFTRILLRLGVLIALVAVPAVVATAARKPPRTGILRIASNRGATFHGTNRNDELLGGNGSDTLFGRGGADILWGDKNPGSQNGPSQHDRIYGGAGNDFIDASHGLNDIYAGPGNDVIRAHFGRGIIDCGSGFDVVHVSHRSRRHYRLRHCERISFH